ncbi:MAG TPA: ATP-dependent DNA helicase RecG [Thermoanaerobaculia bacterium]|nr:ATP-dependent DNA helicase RecG [Thermoanaerobaculia bacterium]
MGPARAQALAAAGYRRVTDLLFHLPFRYEDRRAISSVADVLSGPGTGFVGVVGRIERLQSVFVRHRGPSLVRGVIRDDSGELPVVWFNRPFLPKQIAPDALYLLWGGLQPARPSKSEGKAPEGTPSPALQLLNPSCERAEAAIHGARIAPIYPTIAEFSTVVLRRLLDAALDRLDLSAIPEHLPEALRARHALPPIGAALRYLHRPPDDAEPATLAARRTPAQLRLIYGELLDFQLEIARFRALSNRSPRIHRYRIDENVRAAVRAILPFRLTAAQKRALGEIAEDLKGPHPMLRLLQGDVGSGKTIVAALALAIAAENGLQGAFMAPTELLAEQHYASLERLLGQRYRVGLLTASAADPAARRAALARGEIQIAVGTHALIQEGIRFARLGLAVVDEQHRFGVAQRRLLQAKGERPDLLVMTATPIPRSLTLALYGDLDLSVLDELPPGRSPIETEVVTAARRRGVYARLGADLAAGARGYVVFPLIEESEEVDAGSVAELGALIRDQFPDVPSAALHGRLPAAEREAILRSFAAGSIRLLVATTVIEVGIDVPEASWMVIESAERFGLAQLHQLRGRVGRGSTASRCVAIHGKLSEEGRRRLEVFAETGDGFRIAEADLAIRGPGELLGNRQSGVPLFRVADLLADQEWLGRARDDAHELLDRWDEPELAALRTRIEARVRRRAGALDAG